MRRHLSLSGIFVSVSVLSLPPDVLVPCDLLYADLAEDLGSYRLSTAERLSSKKCLNVHLGMMLRRRFPSSYSYECKVCRVYAMV